jgi:hypothetical protein
MLAHSVRLRLWCNDRLPMQKGASTDLTAGLSARRIPTRYLRRLNPR